MQMICCFRFKKVESPLCDFCGNKVVTLEHLFFYCVKVRSFCVELKELLDSLKITINSLGIKDILFGILDHMEVFYSTILSLKVNSLYIVVN